MKAIGKRLGRLEERFTVPTGPRQRIRVVSHAMAHELRLETSTCRRTLDSRGLLTEIVHLDGYNSVTDDELERFIESFPIEMV